MYCTYTYTPWWSRRGIQCVRMLYNPSFAFRVTPPRYSEKNLKMQLMHLSYFWIEVTLVCGMCMSGSMAKDLMPSSLLGAHNLASLKVGDLYRISTHTCHSPPFHTSRTCSQPDESTVIISKGRLIQNIKLPPDLLRLAVLSVTPSEMSPHLI